MELLIEIYKISGIVLGIYMSSWFVMGQILKRNDVADIAWGLGFILVAWIPFVFFDIKVVPYLVSVVLVTIWGLRLATHIYLRNRNKGEDKRYVKWREDWGRWFFIRSFFQVYLLQGFLLLLIVSPVIILATSNEARLSTIGYIGIAVWLIGFFFESVGDYQLSQFIKNPQNKGRIMTSGLWQYTRHPNYFGEVTQWWGIFLIAVCVPLGWIAVTGPLVISFLILKVSGIPMLEKSFAGRVDFEEYKRQTSAFFPWFKKEI